MLKPVCKNTQGEGLSFSGGLFRSLPISEYARQLQNFGEPATIFFLLVLNRKSHTVTSPQSYHSTRKRSSLTPGMHPPRIQYR